MYFLWGKSDTKVTQMRQRCNTKYVVRDITKPVQDARCSTTNILTKMTLLAQHQQREFVFKN